MHFLLCTQTEILLKYNHFQVKKLVLFTCCEGYRTCEGAPNWTPAKNTHTKKSKSNCYLTNALLSQAISLGELAHRLHILDNTLLQYPLTAHVLRAISSEPFEPCLWLVSPNSSHPTVCDAPRGWCCGHLMSCSWGISLQPCHAFTYSCVPPMHIPTALLLQISFRPVVKKFPFLCPGHHHNWKNLLLWDTVSLQTDAGLWYK